MLSSATWFNERIYFNLKFKVLIDTVSFETNVIFAFYKFVRQHIILYECKYFIIKPQLYYSVCTYSIQTDSVIMSWRNWMAANIHFKPTLNSNPIWFNPGRSRTLLLTNVGKSVGFYFSELNQYLVWNHPSISITHSRGVSYN